MAILGMAFAPLHSLTSKADSIIQKIDERIQTGMKSGEYSTGLQKQLAIQLESLSTKQPGCEISAFPRILVVPQVCRLQRRYAFLTIFSNVSSRSAQPNKKYLTISPTFNHPFSRGSTVAYLSFRIFVNLFIIILYSTSSQTTLCKHLQLTLPCSPKRLVRASCIATL